MARRAWCNIATMARDHSVAPTTTPIGPAPIPAKALCSPSFCWSSSLPVHARRLLRGRGAHSALAGARRQTSPPAQTTRIFDDSETPSLLAELHGLENREVLSADQIPQVCETRWSPSRTSASTNTAGSTSWPSSGPLGRTSRNGEIVQGGSTITQQFIKNAFITDDQTLDRKLREAALAYQLEKQWSKEKILNEYLNIIYFGEGAYGIEAAAQTYFGVHAADLTTRPGGAPCRAAQGSIRLLAPA